MTKLERPRGTHDILPSEQPLWRRVTGEMERLTALYGYRPIQTPVFEDTDLFLRTSGQGSDVVQKEMYTFADRSDRSLTLRPEGTAPICRAYVEHGLHREPQPQKLYTIAPMYRYGAPGRGRYREHWQLSVEAIGTDDPAIDAEIIQLYDTLLRRLGIASYRLELNSIGCRDCRPAYVEQLTAWLEEHRDELDEEAQAEAADEPAARLRRQERADTRALLEGRAQDRRLALRRLQGALRSCPGRPRRDRRRLRARSDARPRARLLLAHDLGVHRPDGQRELDHLRRRPLRLPRRGDRRAAHAGRRLRSRDRAAADRDRGRGRRRRGGACRRGVHRGRARRRRASSCHHCCRACATAGSRPTRTTPAARSRVS